MPEITLPNDPAYCGCAETLLYNMGDKTTYRVKKPHWHSCDYIRIVNSKIVANAMLADKIIENMPSRTAQQKEIRRGMWVSAFSRHMDRDRQEVLLRMEENEKLMRSIAAEREKDDAATASA